MHARSGRNLLRKTRAKNSEAPVLEWDIAPRAAPWLDEPFAEPSSIPNRARCFSGGIALARSLFPPSAGARQNIFYQIPRRGKMLAATVTAGPGGKEFAYPLACAARSRSYHSQWLARSVQTSRSPESFRVATWTAFEMLLQSALSEPQEFPS
jgi:hypothetical protein